MECSGGGGGSPEGACALSALQARRVSLDAQGEAEQLAASGALETDLVVTNQDALVRFRQLRQAELEHLGGLRNVRPFPKLDFRGIYLWDWFVPEVVCPGVQRVGRFGDGGKWLCGLSSLVSRGPAAQEALARGQKPSCVIFSYGINNEASFDAELLARAPACVLHAFDPTIPNLPQELLPFSARGLAPALATAGLAAPAAPNGSAPAPTAPVRRLPARATWHKLGISGATGGMTASGTEDFPWVENLTDAMWRLSVDFVDLLKVDVEGAEFPSLIPVLKARTPGVDPPLFGELLIELHADDDDDTASDNTTAGQIFQLMELLHLHGYRIFSKEENLAPSSNGRPPSAIEYSFIHPEAWALREQTLQAAATVPPAQAPAAATAPAAGPAPRAAAAGAALPQKIALELELEPAAAEAAADEAAGKAAGAPAGSEVAPPQLLGQPVAGGGVIYILTHVERLEQLRRVLGGIHENFNWDRRYPVVIFHENISEAQQDELRRQVTEGLYDLRFIDAGEIFARPLPVPPEVLAAGLPVTCRCSPKSSTLGYRRMAHFHAFLAHEILHEQLGYEWLWRLDDDSEIGAPIGYDPFLLMQANGWKYGTVATVSDAESCVEGLWDLALEFGTKNADRLPHGPGFFDQLPSGVVFYNNFEISHASVWNHPLYQDWERAVLEHGGIFTRRWGDAPIHTLAVSMLLHPQEVHYFDDVAYAHVLVNQTAQGLKAFRVHGESLGCGNSSNHTNTTTAAMLAARGAAAAPDAGASPDGAAGPGCGAGGAGGGPATGVLSRMPWVRMEPTLMVPAEPRGNLSNASNASAAREVELLNAVLYSILEHPDNASRLLKSFGDHFLTKYPYPFVLFFDADNLTIARLLAEKTQELAAHYEGVESQDRFQARQLTYGNASAPVYGDLVAGALLPFPLRLWGVPRLWGAPESQPEYNLKHWRLQDWLSSEMGFEWLWRVSSESTLAQPIGLDVFAEMDARGKRFGYMATWQVDQSWDQAVTLSKDAWAKHNRSISRAGGNSGNDTSGLRSRLAARTAVHFEVEDEPVMLRQWAASHVFLEGQVSHASVWQAPGTRVLLRHFERAYGKDRSLRRFSDPFYTVAVLASLASPAQLMELVDLPYSDPMIPWRQPRVGEVLEVPAAAAPATAGSAAVFAPNASSANTLRSMRLRLLPEGLGGSNGTALWPTERTIRMQTMGWLGGDVGASVPLAPQMAGQEANERLWLFGDSLLGTSTGGVRKRLSKVIHHSVGRSVGRLGPSVFEWGLEEEDTGEVTGADVFPCSRTPGQDLRKCWYWPYSGLEVVESNSRPSASSLVLLAQRIHQGPEIEASVVIVVRNPRDHASLWQWSVADLPGNFSWNGGVAAASGAPWLTRGGPSGEIVYLLGTSGATSFLDQGSAVLGRLEVADLLALQLGRLELLTRPPDAEGQQAASLPGASATSSAGPAWEGAGAPGAEGRAAKLFGSPDSEASLLWVEQLGVWLTVGTTYATSPGRGPGAMTLRAAQRVEGPWSQAITAVVLPEELGRWGICYAPKLHRHSQPPPAAGAPAAGAAATGPATGAGQGQPVQLALSIVCATVFNDPADFVKMPSHVYNPQFFGARLALESPTAGWPPSAAA